MCGIAGRFVTDSESPPPSLGMFERMAEALHHRGPAAVHAREARGEQALKRLNGQCAIAASMVRLRPLPNDPLRDRRGGGTASTGAGE